MDPNADASCNGKCGVAAYKGDGFCDDGNNNCGCGWDSGDCCAPSGKAKQLSFCTICGCVDPGYTKDACSGACGAAAYKGDGFCDDNNNNCGCDWDQGDCCGKSGKSKQFSYCSTCACVDPDMQDGVCSGACSAAGFKGDGFCDDGNNVCGCDWDGGDCCDASGKVKQFSYCSDCMCLDPFELACPGNCGALAFKGDSYCDDDNNICGCDWDGGDCCGDTGSLEQ